MAMISDKNKFLIHFTALTLIAFFFMGCGKQVSSKVDDEGAKSWAGTLNGVKIRIPQYYLFPARVVYEGERRDGLDPASTGATQDSRINNFSIVVRLSNFEPIRTEKDRQDWVVSNKKDFRTSWLLASFDNGYRPNRGTSDQSYMVPFWGPYNRDGDLVYGLTHYVSVQSPEEGDRNGFIGHVEYYFGRERFTRIVCVTHKMTVAPYEYHKNCQQNFILPELNVNVEIFYEGSNIPYWLEFENRIKNIAQSFIVDSSNRPAREGDK
jgi:hypothetical protein